MAELMSSNAFANDRRNAASGTIENLTVVQDGCSAKPCPWSRGGQSVLLEW